MIEIRINTETADEARTEMARLLGTLLTSVASTPAAQKAIIEAAVNGEEPEEVAQKIADATTRERGKPAQGRARRTKEEIAEDEAAEKAESQAISTGGERVGPEDDAEVQKQDAADEKAEVDAARDPVNPLTVDDVKNAFGLYISKHGMDAVKEDGATILGDVLKGEKLPDGDSFWKASTIPQARYADVIKAFEKAAEADKRYGAA